MYDFFREDEKLSSIELGVLMSILNKASCWEYEKEWRLVLLNQNIGKHKVKKYVPVNNKMEAKSIILGHNFLDNFIQELYKDDVSGAKQPFELFQEIADNVKTKKIPLYQITSVKNSFIQNPKTQLNIDFILNFVKKNIADGHFTLSNRNYLYISYWEKLKDGQLS